MGAGDPPTRRWCTGAILVFILGKTAVLTYSFQVMSAIPQKSRQAILTALYRDAALLTQTALYRDTALLRSYYIGIPPYSERLISGYRLTQTALYRDAALLTQTALYWDTALLRTPYIGIPPYSCRTPPVRPLALFL